MKPCPGCGSENADDAAFCFYCGADFPGDTVADIQAPPKKPETYTISMVLQPGPDSFLVTPTLLNRDQLVDFLAHAPPDEVNSMVIHKEGNEVGPNEFDRIIADAAYVEIMVTLAARFRITVVEAMQRFGIQPGYTPYERHENL